MSDLKKEFKSKTIGIIGGGGAMGKWFHNYFSKKGFNVLVSDLKTKMTNKELALNSDIIILSTPMKAAGQVVEEIKDLLGKNKLLMDICSLKEEIVTKMLAETDCEVIGCHPMFGQYTKDLKGQNIVLCSGRGDLYLNFFKSMFEEDRANVVISTPNKHDKFMAIVQGVTHLLTIATGEFLKSEDISPRDILDFSTPVFRVNLGLVGRLFGLDISLYKDLVSRNNMTQEMANRFILSIEKSLKILLDHGDKEKLEFLEGIQDFFGGYSKEGLVETNSIFDHLYK